MSPEARNELLRYAATDGNYDDADTFALAAMLAKLPQFTDERYWEWLLQIWDFMTFVWPYHDWWRMLLEHPIPGRDSVMSIEDHLRLADMPDEITVYRGVRHRDFTQGMSWSANELVAIAYARLKGSGVVRDEKWPDGTAVDSLVVRGTVARDEIVWYFKDRRCIMEEVVVLPGSVTVTDVYHWTATDIDPVRLDAMYDTLRTGDYRFALDAALENLSRGRDEFLIACSLVSVASARDWTRAS